MSILALLMMSVGCRLPHGLKHCMLSGIKRDQFAKNHPGSAREKLMEEFAEILGEYNPRGGERVEWPMSELSEALHCIKMNAETTPKEHWDVNTLLYSPFVPSSRVNRTSAQEGAVDAYVHSSIRADMFCVIKGPVWRVVVETLLPSPSAVYEFKKELMGKSGGGLHSCHVLTEDVAVQEVLESERVVAKVPHTNTHKDTHSDTHAPTPTHTRAQTLQSNVQVTISFGQNDRTHHPSRHHILK